MCMQGYNCFFFEGWDETLDTLFSIKNPSDDFVVEFDVISVPNIMQRVDSRQQQITENLDYIDCCCRFS